MKKYLKITVAMITLSLAGESLTAFNRPKIMLSCALFGIGNAYFLTGHSYTWWNNKIVDPKSPCILAAPRTAYFAQPLPAGKVRIYHCIGDRMKISGNPLESVRKHGLLTAEELWDKGLSKNNVRTFSSVLSDQYQVVYFAYYDEPPANSNCVAFDVDPYKTYVYNKEFRYDANATWYYSSKVLLADYIQRKKQAQVLKSKDQNMAVIYDPWNAQPLQVTRTDHRYANLLFRSNDRQQLDPRHFLYSNEVIIPHSIPASELIFPSEQ